MPVLSFINIISNIIEQSLNQLFGVIRKFVIGYPQFFDGFQKFLYFNKNGEAMSHPWATKLWKNVIN